MTLELVQSAVLGLLQGVTEFLPISSSAHLIVLPWILGWQPLGLTFDVLVHVGTLAAVLVCFSRDWMGLAGDLRAGRWLRTRGGQPALAALLAVATIPVILVGLFAGEAIEARWRGPGVVAFNLAAFGLLLLAADRLGSRRRSVETVGWTAALLIGGFQALALLPGVSRAGITMTAALFLGLTRPEAARFSFLLAGPAIGLAAAHRVLELATTGGPQSFSIGAALVGIMMAALSGFLCINYLLRFLQSGSFLPFVLYRCGLAAWIAFSLWS